MGKAGLRAAYGVYLLAERRIWVPAHDSATRNRARLSAGGRRGVHRVRRRGGAIGADRRTSRSRRGLGAVPPARRHRPSIAHATRPAPGLRVRGYRCTCPGGRRRGARAGHRAARVFQCAGRRQLPDRRATRTRAAASRSTRFRSPIRTCKRRVRSSATRGRSTSGASPASSTSSCRTRGCPARPPIRASTIDRVVNGFANPAFRLSVNLYGAPALDLKDFASYQQDVIVGASLRVSAPWGQYDDTRLVNIGTNRWCVQAGGRRVEGRGSVDARVHRGGDALHRQQAISTAATRARRIRSTRFRRTRSTASPRASGRRSTAPTSWAAARRSTA